MGRSLVVTVSVVVLASCATTRPADELPWRGGRCAHASVAWQLPFPADAAHEVMQGNRGAFSHLREDLYAWDFRMPEGSAVTAAAAGVVVRVTDHFSVGAPERRLANRANVVVVRHAPGLYSVYQHLQAHSAVVRVGQAVRRGELLARSGNTGFSKEPHLHFEVVDRRNVSQPVCFVDVPGGVPQYQGVYRGTATTTPARITPRVLPPGTP